MKACRAFDPGSNPGPGVFLFHPIMLNSLKTEAEIGIIKMNSNQKAEILDKCARLDIPLIGVASVERWTMPLFEPWIPEQFYPQNIFPEAQSVIVLGLPVSLPVIETTPSIYYHELYRTINSLLDQYG